MEFSQAADIMLVREGGLVDDPNDPGGLTKYGISLAAHPELGREGILNLTPSQAVDIYREEYWDAAHCDEFPPYLRMAIFDFAINSGAETAIRHLQRVLDVATDGIVGPETLGAATAAPRKSLMETYLKERVRFLFGNPRFSNYGYGWIARIINVAFDDLDF